MTALDGLSKKLNPFLPTTAQSLVQTVTDSVYAQPLSVDCLAQVSSPQMLRLFVELPQTGFWH